ncbi:MAG: DNA polymerase/3'-5' exonuclease PolX [Candidatus ainarchaeum sp.]|nr:DNA polymerase/3'-5' exonuclease PolX [Candidatus ainarchaeum sp.]
MSKNALAARIFFEVADFLELEGVAWKPVAYRNAARSIEALDEAVEDVYARGGEKALKGIPGVGDAIAKKLAEIIETGKLKYHAELKKEFPFDMESLTGIPGIGPKKAKKLFDALGVKDRRGLRKAALARKVRGVEGFDEKTEENILRGIELVEKSAGRVPLGYVLHDVNQLIGKMKRLAPVTRIIAAGSTRRMKETIGDIDILATSSDPKGVMDAFTALPEAGHVVAKGETRSTITLKTGLNCDLRVVSEDEYGSALQYLTGSKEHSVELRKIAISRGLKLNEYGVFRGGKRVAGKTEEGVYRALGMDYIEPELRELNGEIKAAQKHELPELVGLNEIRGDFHVHSDWSDGSSPILGMAKAAGARGYEYVAITDHAGKLKIAGGLDEKGLERHSAAVEEAEKEAGGIRLLKGAEVDITKDGGLAVSAAALKRLDFVVASVHSNFNMPEKEMTARYVKAIEGKAVHAIGHPGCREIGARNAVKADFGKVYEAAAGNGVFLEINAFPTRMDLWDREIKRAKYEFGAQFVLGTDSHNEGHLRFMETGVGMARRGWAEKQDLVNSLSFKELSKKLGI